MSHFYVEEQSSLIFMCSRFKSFSSFVYQGAEILMIQYFETLFWSKCSWHHRTLLEASSFLATLSVCADDIELVVMLALHSHLSWYYEEQTHLHTGKSYLPSQVQSRVLGSQGSELGWSMARRLRIGQFSNNLCQCFRRGPDTVSLKPVDLCPCCIILKWRNGDCWPHYFSSEPA